MASIPMQEEFLAATRKSQEAMIAAIKTWFEAVRTATPRLTSVYAPLTGRLPKLPVSLPFADKLPTPEEAVDNAYHLAELLLANQRQFAEDVLKTMAPLMPGRHETAPRANGSRERKIPSHRVWQEAVAVSEPKPVAVSQPKPVAVSEPKPVAVTEKKPAVSEPKTAATAAKPEAPARPAAKSTPTRPAPKTTPAAAKSSASRSTTPRSTTPRSTTPRSTAPKSTPARPEPKGTDAS